MLEMKRFGGVSIGLVALGLAFTISCGGAKKDADAPNGQEGDVDASDGTSSSSSDSDAGGSASAGGDDATKPKNTSVCGGFDLDLLQVLGQSACELAKPDDKQRDPKGVLEIKVTTSAAKIAPGAHVDLVVTLTNKGKEALALDLHDAVSPLA